MTRVLTNQKQFVRTVRSQYLGDRMRQLREQRELSVKYVAAYLGVEEATLGRCERAEWPFRHDHVASLLDAFELYDDAERARMLDLAQQAWRINEWQRTDDQRPGTAGGQVVINEWWLLNRASELFVYGHLLVPPAVQTREYAEAIARHTINDPRHGDKYVGRLLDRQQALEDRKPPTRLEILIDEPALHRPIGGRLVLQQQLRHLNNLVGDRPHVKVRVLPTRTGWHPGLDGAFTVCAMHRPYSPVVLVEHHNGRLVIEAGAGHQYLDTFEKLRDIAMSPAESQALINTLAEELHP